MDESQFPPDYDPEQDEHTLGFELTVSYRTFHENWCSYSYVARFRGWGGR